MVITDKGGKVMETLEFCGVMFSVLTRQPITVCGLLGSDRTPTLKIIAQEGPELSYIPSLLPWGRAEPKGSLGETWRIENQPCGAMRKQPVGILAFPLSINSVHFQLPTLLPRTTSGPLVQWCCSFSVQITSWMWMPSLKEMLHPLQVSVQLESARWCLGPKASRGKCSCCSQRTAAAHSKVGPRDKCGLWFAINKSASSEANWSASCKPLH